MAERRNWKRFGANVLLREMVGEMASGEYDRCFSILQMTRFIRFVHVLTSPEVCAISRSVLDPSSVGEHGKFVGVGVGQAEIKVDLTRALEGLTGMTEFRSGTCQKLLSSSDCTMTYISSPRTIGGNSTDFEWKIDHHDPSYRFVVLIRSPR